MVQPPTRYITQEAFEQFCLEHPDRMFERTAQGELVEKLRSRMMEYVASGLRLGWLINPQDQQVEIYQAGQAVEVVSIRF